MNSLDQPPGRPYNLPMKNRAVLLCLLPAALAALLLTGSCRRAPSRPNIVLIVVDALRADHLPFYGYRLNTAPFLGSLAERGAVFANAFSASNWTVQSTAALMTSVHPFQLRSEPEDYAGGEPAPGTQFRVGAVAATVPSLAMALKKRGYRTFAVSSNLFVARGSGFDRGFDRFQDFHMKTDGRELNAKVREWRGAMKGAPYFLYIHYTDTHVPYVGRAPFYRQRADRREDYVARYDSDIRYVDQNIQALFRDMGWKRGAALIVTADHGEEFWEHGYRGHGKNFYNGSVRVPLLVHYPQGMKKGAVIEANAGHVDVLPTACELAGAPIPPHAEGVGLLKAMRGDEGYLQGRPIYLYIERGHFRYHGVVRDGWKWIANRGNGREFLFDMKVDPQERNNLAIREEFAALRKGMQDSFLSFAARSRKYDAVRIRMELTPEKIKELKTLGYLD